MSHDSILCILFILFYLAELETSLKEAEEENEKYGSKLIKFIFESYAVLIKNKFVIPST